MNFGLLQKRVRLARQVLAGKADGLLEPGEWEPSSLIGAVERSLLVHLVRENARLERAVHELTREREAKARDGQGTPYRG